MIFLCRNQVDFFQISTVVNNCVLFVTYKAHLNVSVITRDNKNFRDVFILIPDLNGAAGISDNKFWGDINLPFKFSFT